LLFNPNRAAYLEEMAESNLSQGTKTLDLKGGDEIHQSNRTMSTTSTAKRATPRVAKLAVDKGSLIVLREESTVNGGGGGGGVESFESRYQRVILEREGESPNESEDEARSADDEQGTFRKTARQQGGFGAAPELASFGDKISHFEKERGEGGNDLPV
jgi:hypothetical protein